MTVWTEQMPVSEILLVDFELKKHASSYSWPTFCLPVVEKRNIEAVYKQFYPDPTSC